APAEASLILRLLLADLASHRHKGDGHDGALPDLAVALLHHEELLISRLADRDDHPPALLELLDQRLRHAIRCAGHDDRVKRRLLLPAEVAVAVTHLHVLVAKPREIFLRTLRQRLHDLDRANLTH